MKSQQQDSNPEQSAPIGSKQWIQERGKQMKEEAAKWWEENKHKTWDQIAKEETAEWEKKKAEWAKENQE